MSHNEPVQHAQAFSTGVVTVKELLDVVKLGSESLGMHGDATPNRASYSDSFVFTVNARKKDRKSGAETTLSVKVPGYVSNGHTSAREEHRSTEGNKYTTYSSAFRPLTGHWYLSYGPREALIDVLDLLPSNAEVSFWVQLDAGTNELLIRADAPMNYETVKGLHCDHLYLEATYMVRGKQKTRRYLIDTHVSAHNTARFGGPRT